MAEDTYDIYPLEEAAAILRRELREFPFADHNHETGQCRSMAVIVGGMLDQFASGLVPPGANRPGFLVNANAPRSGKTLLIKFILYIAHGQANAQAWPSSNEELAKTLASEMLSGATYVFFDNVRRRIASDTLEALMTSATFRGRLLGGNQMLEAGNSATIFLSANDASANPDLGGRFLTADLFVDESAARDRNIDRVMEDRHLIDPAWRKQMASALHSVVHHWVAAGQPRHQGESPLKGFETWCAIIPAIVQFAGFGDCLVPPFTMELDTDSSDMKRLVTLLACHLIESDAPDRVGYTFRQIVDTCYAHELLNYPMTQGHHGKELEEDVLDNEGMPKRDAEGHILKRTRLILPPASQSRFAHFLRPYFPAQPDPSASDTAEAPPRKRRFTIPTATLDLHLLAYSTGRGSSKRYVLERVREP